MEEFKIKDIAVKDYEGKGEPLIFIHAFPLCNRMWDPQVEHFKDRYRVITYDLRGLGYSNDLDSYQYTLEDFADDLITIIDEMSLGKVHACGLSMGGYILQRAVIKKPSKFRSLILADTRSERDDNAGLLNRANTVNMIKAGGKEEFIKEFTKKLLGENSYNNEELRAFVEKMISWQDEKGICGALIAMATRTDTTEQLKEVIIPALIICGENDILTPLHFSEQMNKALPVSELITIPGAGHLTNMENPDLFNKIVEDFLS